MRELTYTNSRTAMLPKDYTKSAKFLERNYAILAGIFASLGAFCIGTCIAWSSAAIQLLSHETFPLTIDNMTSRQVSWIIAGFCLGATLSPLFVYKIWRFTGSKLLILTACIFLLTSWVFLSIFESLIWILCARLLAGIAVGCLHFLLPIYIHDISSHELRITLDYIWHTFLALGIFMEYAAVFIENYQVINTLSALAPIILFIGFLFMPESPRYSCYKQESNAAKDVLRRFREIGYEADEDIRHWKERTEFSLKTVFKHPSNVRKILTVIVLIIFDQLVGVLGCFFYLSWNFRILGGEYTSDVSALIIAAIFVVSIFMDKLVGLKFSDKTTLIWTSILQAASLIVLGFYLHWKGSFNEVEEYNYLPLICYGIYVLFYGMGQHRLVWKLIRYLVPRSRYFAARALCTSISWAVLVSFTRGYADFVEFVGIGWLFWFMALTCLGFMLLAIILVPNDEKLNAEYQIDEEKAYASNDIEQDSQ